ncbi:uncharacterized protein YALI1_F05876g [Yarrowia lipolytica]|uniref:Uncharacterized protein n=1 Tax=Yarrowia lipolytica TaxID=4952 RepID=A0A1D8NLW2_YARLL|nr:hypothetical protein YALI1_F05876g [Yarrowia lipolytica]
MAKSLPFYHSIVPIYPTLYCTQYLQCSVPHPTRRTPRLVWQRKSTPLTTTIHRNTYQGTNTCCSTTSTRHVCSRFKAPSRSYSHRHNMSTPWLQFLPS